MTNTDILLEDLEDVLDDATSIPLSKKCAVDVDKIKTIIEDIRLNTPQETKQAKAIVDSRNTKQRRKLPKSSKRHKLTQETLLLATKSQRLLRQRLRNFFQRLTSRARLWLRKHRIRLPKSSATPQHRLMRWLHRLKISREKCSTLLIIMQTILFFQSTMHFIRHSQMFAASVRASQTLKTKKQSN